MPTDQLRNMREMRLPEDMCPYCTSRISESTVSIDHIIPKSEEGSNDYRNKIWVCATCNSLIKKNKLYGARKLPSKTATDSLGKKYVNDATKRKEYVAGIRGVIMDIRYKDGPLK
jgi:5-methylcytosine-specific restriction endonuclease McrA